jgi:hypothetical protein
MVRSQIYLDEPLDKALIAEARRLGISKSELIRRTMADAIPHKVEPTQDLWAALAGMLGDGPEIPDIDAVIYGLPPD